MYAVLELPRIEDQKADVFDTLEQAEAFCERFAEWDIAYEIYELHPLPAAAGRLGRGAAADARRVPGGDGAVAAGDGAGAARGGVTARPRTVADIRAEVEAAKKLAMANFTRDWGTGDVREVWGALAQSIPGSASGGDAMRKARRRLARPAGE